MTTTGRAGGDGGGGSRLLSGRVGLFGVLALVVGNAISVPIYVLSGPLAGAEGLGAGPAVILAAVLAAIPAGFVVLYNALLGSAMPVAGGLYVYISRLTAPFWGFLVPWTLPLVIWASLLVTATGFAEYARFFVDLPVTVLVYVLFVAALVVSLLTFILPGAAAVDPANYTPFVPDVGALGLAAVALFYPFLGFGLLVELGEEIDDPSRTIPLALFVSVGVVALFYVALVAVLVGVVPWTELGHPNDVGTAASRFLPPWAAGVVVAGALFAVVTTVNTSLLVASRTIMRAGRDGVFPEVLAYVDPRFDTPVVALLVMGIPPLFLVPIADELVGLAAFIGLASLTAYFFSAVGLWNLPREFPEHYENAAFMLKRERGLLVAVVAGALATAAFWVVSLLRLPVVGVVLVGWFVLGYVAYRYRVSRGDPAETFRTMTSLAEHEAAFARNRGSDVEED